MQDLTWCALCSLPAVGSCCCRHRWLLMATSCSLPVFGRRTLTAQVRQRLSNPCSSRDAEPAGNMRGLVCLGKMPEPDAQGHALTDRQAESVHVSCNRCIASWLGHGSVLLLCLPILPAARPRQCNTCYLPSATQSAQSCKFEKQMLLYAIIFELRFQPCSHAAEEARPWPPRPETRTEH